MTPEEHHRAVVAIVERTRAEQGLPRYVEDPATLARIARILLAANR